MANPLAAVFILISFVIFVLWWDATRQRNIANNARVAWREAWQKLLETNSKTVAENLSLKDEIWSLEARNNYLESVTRREVVDICDLGAIQNPPVYVSW
jgi:hypothetical protein